jgi:hypothetical protein
MITFFLLFSQAAWCDERPVSNVPFRQGEKLTFVLKWTVIPAGEAVLEVMPQEIIDNEETHHFVLTARSNAFVDPFYKVRDRIDAWTDRAVSRSVLYRKKQHEGRTRRDITVTFDWERNTVSYSNHGKKRAPVPISEGTFDPLSVFYWFRLQEIMVGKQVKRMVTDGKKKVLGIADVVRKEKIKVPAGIFETYLIEPDISHIGGVFEKSPDAKIQLWISADGKRIPIRIKSKVVVGSFSGELVSIAGDEPPLEKR